MELTLHFNIWSSVHAPKSATGVNVRSAHPLENTFSISELYPYALLLCSQKFPCVETPSPPPPPLPTSPPPPKSELEDVASPPINIIIRGPSLDSSASPTIIRGPSFNRSDSPPLQPPPLELDVCEEEIVVFRDDALRSSGAEVVRVTVEAHVEPEPRIKRQRITREPTPLTLVCISRILEVEKPKCEI